MSATNKPLNADPALDDESAVPRILGLGITFHVLALAFFGLRMYTRIFVVKSFGKDDVLMVLCMVISSPFPLLISSQPQTNLSPPLRLASRAAASSQSS